MILKKLPTIYWLSLVITTIVGAIILALIIGVIRQKGIIERAFARININAIHPAPTAWDYYFSKQEESWIIVTLKSGKSIYGKFSEHSFSSSDTEERDLYIEKTYIISDDMSWEEDEKSKGILISKDEIETIEFFT